MLENQENLINPGTNRSNAVNIKAIRMEPVGENYFPTFQRLAILTASRTNRPVEFDFNGERHIITPQEANQILTENNIKNRIAELNDELKRIEESPYKSSNPESHELALRRIRKYIELEQRALERLYPKEKGDK